MRIVLSPAARAELWDVWNHNVKQHSPTHADDYEAFLTDGMGVLADEPKLGDPVEGFPDLHAITIKRRTRGHGHVAVCRVEEEAGIIRVLHIFHTAQDVLGRLERE